MTAEAETYTPLTDREKVQSIIDELVANGEAIGSWTTKSESRQTGASIYVKYEQPVDITASLRFVALLQECPALLVDACRRLLLADALLRDDV